MLANSHLALLPLWVGLTAIGGGRIDHRTLTIGKKIHKHIAVLLAGT